VGVKRGDLMFVAMLLAKIDRNLLSTSSVYWSVDSYSVKQTAFIPQWSRPFSVV